MILFGFNFVLLTACALVPTIHKRGENDYVCPCPNLFKKVPGVPFKCYSVSFNKWNLIRASFASSFCQDRDAILFEPVSNEEADCVAGNLRRVYSPTDRFFIGYARKPSLVSLMQCENVTEPDFHSVSTCTEVPDSMKWAPGRPDERGDYEFCVEYIRGYGMNDVRCESSFVKWIVCQYTRNCPSDFEMANGISDKCFMVQSAHGHKGAKKAKEFCEARNAILYEPKSRDELLRLENHFTQLKTRVYFVGYVEQRSGLGCENKGDFVYHGISSCTDAPKGLFFEKEPNNCEGLGEWCVVSREHGGERYLNFRSCNFTGVDFVVCQFNKHCGN